LYVLGGMYFGKLTVMMRPPPMLSHSADVFDSRTYRYVGKIRCWCAGVKVRGLPRPAGLRDIDGVLALLPHRTQWIFLAGLVLDGCSMTRSRLHMAWGAARGSPEYQVLKAPATASSAAASGTAAATVKPAASKSTSPPSSADGGADDSDSDSDSIAD
jgi:hypothetical protein